ncbi:hypothetical protein [Cohnella sp. GCM10012308]|uniref:hypothetical protein n=1 Tax=Cohnella sp. GCM10012308 TaxID=3317329 RepID=UPI003612BCB2
MTIETTSPEPRSLLEEALRHAVMRQQEAIAGFIQAAALHLHISARSIAEGVHRSEVAAPSAKPLADAAAAAAERARKLDELQRLAWEIAHDLNVPRPPSSLRRPPATSEAAVANVRFTNPEKAAPAWIASPNLRKK